MKQNLLNNFPKTIAPMVNMALELGINYQEFDALVKQVFIQEAETILTSQNKKITDASISIVSGISRTAIAKAMKKSNSADANPWISMPAKIVAQWLFKDLNKMIPYSSTKNAKGSEIDFVTLTKEVTTEKSSKTILNELIRLNYVKVMGDSISLIIFNKEAENTEKMQLVEFSDNIQAHSLAGVGNIMNAKGASFLEQAIKVDGIHENSAKQLSKCSTEIWEQASKTFINEARPISDKEEKQEGKHKLIFGAYCYYK